MHLENGAGFFAYGRLVVGDVGAVGGAHFDKPRPTLSKHAWNAKAAAYFHGFTARHYNLFVSGQCSKAKHHRGGVVVHYQSRLCSADLGY